ncbi:protein timeless isoform X2 [Galleria mellonella]|uniref:Protein timeless isoform X2 n=1 Tax=Galleria mellonella TaxID=7137 RepID=A0ABM3MZT4_GALME|nr:protein timeless isoform X2 [Galleria mellonella]
MEWVLRSPQIHSTFSNLGFVHGDGYHINENCNAALEAILHNILTEDKYLRTYRRSISFGENIKKDLIPLLIHAKEDSTIEFIVKILVNLTIPVECLLSIDALIQNDFGRHTVFEINNLLLSTKSAFTDNRTTRVIIDFMKKNVDVDQKTKLSTEQCTNISNCLLLLRNILHIPEDNSNQSPSYNGSNHSVQNQILWNLFSQSIDKILIKLMTLPDATHWGVTMVQLIALLYKDQHVITLHKLLNLWLEASLSDSSEDNESNTSPPDRGSDDSSPMLTSDPTSDSSDTGGSGKCNDEPNSVNNGWDASSMKNTSENGNQSYQKSTADEKKAKDEDMRDSSESTSCSEKVNQKDCEKSDQKELYKNEKKTVISENSDCGYGTQMENQGSISTSSNEDEPAKKPVHQKPHNTKQRSNNKARSSTNLQDRKRKKLVKRGKANIINVQGLSHKTPTDDDISNIMKEFTVDFLLKGYNSLVQTLHSQIITNMQLEIDTSHFFWLVTYFLKFATQIELDLEHICSVLSYDIVSYLTAEGVNLCEQFELSIKLDGNDLKPSIRRLHLVVTAIREFVQAIEVYKKIAHVCKEDQEALLKLQMKMCETEDLRCLLVLLLRHYDPKYHTKQYLQDLIVTNHILLMFLDSVMKLPDYSGSTYMLDHIKQFATPEIMYQYGLLLEDYAGNGEFVNDCIFTLMHHVGGELDCLITLFQPKILKTFTSIWKSEFEICDDWSDLIEYVINTFIKKPHALQSTTNFRLDTENFDEDNFFVKPLTPSKPTKHRSDADSRKRSDDISGSTSRESYKWTEEELSSLSWNYMQCSALPDVIGEIIKLYKEDDAIKSRESVIRELHKQNLISKDECDNFLNKENNRGVKVVPVHKEMREDEIGKLCDQLSQDGKSKFLDWVQKVLLDTCYAKIYVEKKEKMHQNETHSNKSDKLLNFELFKKKSDDLPVMSPVSYHSILFNQSVPLVPWNCEQASICKDLKFLQLLHKLGFHMPVDSGKVFIRIPHFWTADFLYDVAAKISPIDNTKLNFSLNDIMESSSIEAVQQNSSIISDLTKDVTMVKTPDNFFQIHKQKHLATMVNFTPMPGSSFNIENEEGNKHNWLEVIQKSQDYKITLNLENHIIKTEDIHLDVEMQLPPKEISSASPLKLVTTPVIADTVSPSLVLPTVMSAKQESSSFNLHLADTEYYNNSVCETASVASDLTRMYVSDEDEKPELLLRPVVDVNPLLDDRFSSDCDNASAEKRPRVHFSSMF